MQEFFLDNRGVILFLHVMSGVVWVGGMVAMRYAAHPSFMQIESPAHRMQRILDALKRLFTIVTPFVVLLLITAVLMIKGYNLGSSELSFFAHAKEGIWTLMALNLGAMIWRRNRAQKALDTGNYADAKRLLGLIGSLMVPLNIALGIIAIALGTTLSIAL